MLIWFRRLWPAALAASLLIGIYLIFPPFGNDQAAMSGKRGLAAFVTHNDPKPLPTLVFQDAAGNSLSLEAFSGKVVLLNLWATWCAPCRKEMPDLAELEAQLGGPDFTVVAISIDRKGVEASRAFLQEVKADRLQLYTDVSAKMVADLKSPGLPTTLLIDRQGQELGRLMGPADWASPEAVSLVKHAIADESP